MEELINSVNSIAEALKSGTPAWVTIIAGFAPIILTIITIILSYRMDIRNRELQKMIHKQNTELQQLLHNRDALNQSRQDILSVYNAFSEALLTVQSYGAVENVFSNEQITYTWCQELTTRKKEVLKAFDKAKLLLNDKELTDYLEKVREKYMDVYNCIARYTYNNLHTETLKSARMSIMPQYGNGVYDLTWLAMNPTARDQIIKLCENVNTKEINEKIKQFSEMLSDDKFDYRFKKYIEIKELAEKAE